MKAKIFVAGNIFMIAVVNYGIEKNHPLIKLFSKLKIDFKVTHNESEILHSDKMILPNADSIASAVK
jgi:imidazoleglycerol phosphate synthase glutamine amidotransferase subunit HisH